MHAASCAGRRDLEDRLIASLEIDATAARTALGWTASVEPQAGLAAMAAATRSC